MKKFKFRYQSIHKMRMDNEERVKNELAVLFGKKQKLLDQLNQLMDKESAYLKWIEKAFSEGIKPYEMNQISDGKSFYKRQKEAVKQQIEQVNQSITAKQDELLEAVKERKIMDKLKEKALEKYIEEYNAQEMKTIEEIVNYKNNKSTGE